MREKIAEIIHSKMVRLYSESLEDADKILALFAHREKLLQTLLQDSVEDDRAIRELAMEVLPKAQVEGDSYGVPTIVDIVEWLVNKIEQMGGCGNEKERDRTV